MAESCESLLHRDRFPWTGTVCSPPLVEIKLGAVPNGCESNKGEKREMLPFKTYSTDLAHLASFDLRPRTHAFRVRRILARVELIPRPNL